MARDGPEWSSTKGRRCVIIASASAPNLADLCWFGVSQESGIEFTPDDIISRAGMQKTESACPARRARLTHPQLDDIVANRSSRTRPRLRPADRLLWASLSRVGLDWRYALMIVKPGTVITRHRKGFRSAGKVLS